MISSILRFWLYHPALLYGISLMLGIFCSLSLSFCLMIPCSFLWIPFLINLIQSKHKESLNNLLLTLFVFLSAWIYTSTHYVLPSLPPEGSLGMAHVKIENITLQSNFFGKNWLYRCEIAQFFPSNRSTSIASSLPGIIILRGKGNMKSPPIVSQEYWVPGKLIKNPNGIYVLKVSSKAEWTAIAGTENIADRRFLWKKRVSAWIESQFSHSSSASFLAGFVTGEFDDYVMKGQFARFGLQHLLAISGFHFAIIAGFLSLILRFFLPISYRTIVLLILLGGYCFFLGPQPSILRAWIMCSLVLIGGLVEKQSSPLNALGLALLMILGYNPLLSQELGFQLSFGITAAILLLYSPAQSLCNSLIPKRSLSEALKMNGWNQHAYCILAFFRQGLTLTLTVNLIALPMTLYYFQQFPWMSLIYNFFFPFLASASLCLLLMGGILSFIPYLGSTIHDFNDYYTFFLLQLAYQIPAEADHYLGVQPFHSFWLILYMCSVFIGGMIWRERLLLHSQDEPRFTFV